MEEKIRKSHVCITNKGHYEALQQSIRDTPVTDIIRLDTDSAEEISKFWKPVGKDGKVTKIDAKGVPSDIIISGTIPITGISFEFKDSNREGIVAESTVLISDGYQQAIEDAKALSEIENGKELIYNTGAIVIKIMTDAIVIPLFISSAKPDYLTLGVTLGFRETAYKDAEIFFRCIVSNAQMRAKDLGISTGADDFRDFATWLFGYAVHVLHIWYGCQIAMLHPATITVFQKPKIQKRSREERLKTHKRNGKTSVKYVKKHIISAGDIENSLIRAANHMEVYEEDGESDVKRQYVRHALLWRVIGHFRTYKTGKRVFVKPYWKGVLKDFQVKGVEANHREIDIPEGN